MKITKLFLLLIIFTTLSNFTPLNAQWYEKSNGLPNSWSAGVIDAYDSLIAVGPCYPSIFLPDSFYITTDGGNIWDSRPLPINLVELYDISIIGENKIWFCDGWSKIYNTIDGGFNWQLQFDDTSMTNSFYYIEMFDSLNGVAMGGAPNENNPVLVLRTTDGGNNWVSMNDSSLIGLRSAYQWRTTDFIDMNTGYFFSKGESPNKLYKTTNGGKSWVVINDTLYYHVLKAYDENIILGNVGSNVLGFIYRSFDGGQTWKSEKWDILGWGKDIEYIPDNPSDVWYIWKSVCFSSDTGKTWVEEVNVEGLYFSDIVFTDEDYGWLLAYTSENRHIYRTTNGGHGGIVTVDDNQSNNIISNFILEQNYPNPFNPTTTIKYQIPELSFVTIKVYDVLGNEITTLVNEEAHIGSYEVEFNASTLPSGIYFYRLQAGSFVETKKMVLMK